MLGCFSFLLCSAGLAIGLGIGAIAEVAKKALKPQHGGKRRIDMTSIDLNDSITLHS